MKSIAVTFALFATTLPALACSEEDTGKSSASSGAGGGAARPGSNPTAGRGPDVGQGGGLVIDVPPASGGSAASGGAATCGVQDFNRERKPAEVLLVLDRSGSMGNELMNSMLSRWDAMIPTVSSAIQSTAKEIWWGLKSYPELDETEGCAPESIVPKIHVPIAENNAATVVAAVQATTPLGDGTPTGDAIRFGLAHLRERATKTDNPKFMLLATDGEPNCPSDSGVDYTVAQLTEALAAGFPTFVIGVDTTKRGTIRNLNAMAIAGGRPRTPSAVGPNAEPISFYLASTQAEIQAALEAITGEISSCVFELKPAPPVPDNIAVDFSGVRTERDPTRQNGWEYTKDDHTQLQVYGSWCDRIKTEAKNQVNIKYGCPDVPIAPPK